MNSGDLASLIENRSANNAPSAITLPGAGFTTDHLFTRMLDTK